MRNRIAVMPEYGNIRSAYPWMYFDCHDSVIAGDTTLTELADRHGDWDGGVSNFSSWSLHDSGGAGTVWSANEGRITIPAAPTEKIFWERMTDVQSEYQDVMEIGTGAVLMWAVLNPDRVTGNPMTLLYYGRNTSTTPGFSFQFAPAGPNFRVRLTDDTETLQTLNGQTGGPATASQDYVAVAYIDLRSGVKQANIWNQDDSSPKVIKTDQISITLTDPVGWDTSDSVNTSVGIGGTDIVNDGSSTANQVEGQVQRVGMINYGQSPPSNISEIATRLIVNKGIPGRFIRG